MAEAVNKIAHNVKHNMTQLKLQSQQSADHLNICGLLPPQAAVNIRRHLPAGTG